MDFAAVLAQISDHLQRRGHPVAVIDGVPLAALGRPRTTLDLDLVTGSETQEAVVRFLETQGYETLRRSVGCSNHLHSDPGRGRVDFVYVDEER